MTAVLKPRVFISHVNNDPAVEAIWKELRKRLAAGGFDVLIDREILKPGDLWRTEIYSWIGLCDAAVVLVSRQALEAPARVWVARETACLIFRRALDPSLRIIPVLLGDVSFADLESNDRFRDLQLSEVQCVIGADNDRIVDALADLQARDGPPRLSLVAGHICGFLAEWHASQIEAILHECDVDLGHWAERQDPFRRLALCLLTMDIGSDVSRMPRILGRLYQYKESLLPQILKIANLLLPGLVEIEAIRGIVEEGLKKSDDPTRRALWINAPGEDIAEHYAARAFPDVQPQWKLLRLPCVFGEAADPANAKRQLINQIEKVIEREIFIPVEARRKGPAYARGERLKRCNRLVNDGRPVFMTAELGKLAATLVPTIKNDYSFATVLLRSEIDADLDEAEGLIRPLTPKLSGKDYDRFSDITSDLYEKLGFDPNVAQSDD